MSEYTGSRLLAFDPAQRRQAVAPGGPLAGLADGLAAELAPLLQRDLPIPEFKARLTRAGGRCPTHGDLLEFDPFAPTTHRCARCGREYTGREHDEWWAMGAGLWTAERAVHAAALYLLRGDADHAALSARILAALAERYLTWPNQDNVLGPSRPFFSTYLESIWLLNICHALDLLETAGAPDIDDLSRHVRLSLIAPSSRLIAGFAEGASNRQVWNEVAILSAMTMLDEDDAFDKRLDSEEGILGIMTEGLLDDGTWYEGENYHLFAHRGLWYAIELLRARSARGHIDLDLPEQLGERYAAGFIAPFAGVLPDDTFPSRRDSKYGVSIRQWRIAEWCELGYAHTGDARLAGVLTRLYDSRHGAAPQDAAGAFATERARSTADAERSAPPTPLSRASLSWRALLMANVDAPPTAPWEPGSVLLPSQGLAVIRRDGGRTYVALEGGHTGGDHGHPDRLALTLQNGANRWLDDPGTGSYVERTLHWYRSTLAHAAPLVDGASQDRRPATLIAFEDRGGAGWVSKRVDGIARGVDMTRTIVVCDGYLVDLLEWASDDDHAITLPIAAEAMVREEQSALGAPWQPATVAGARRLEDGFDFAEGAESRPVAGRGIVAMDAVTGEGESRARLWYSVAASTGTPADLVRATVPGPPGSGPARRHWLTAHGARGFIAGVWSWAPAESATAVASVAFGGPGEPLVTVTTADGTRAQHARAPHGWNIELIAGGARSSIDLGGLAQDDPVDDELTEAGPEGPDDAEPRGMFADYDIPWTDEAALPDPIESEPGAPIEEALLLPLGSAHYMRTEQSWAEAGEPTAMMQLARTDDYLIVDLEVATGPVTAPVPGPDGTLDNPLDNEHPDVNADGVQWYVGKPDDGRWTAAGLLVPVSQPDDPMAPRSHRLVGDGSAEPSCTWTTIEGGWAMRLVWPLASLPIDDDGCIAFDLVVNERPAERERRRGQLVLSGGEGFAYLRGDRQDPARAVVIAVT